MYLDPSMKRYGFCIAIAAMLAAGITGSSSRLAPLNQSPRHASGSVAIPAKSGISTKVDRSHKGDRLAIDASELKNNTTVVTRSAVLPNDVVQRQRPVPARPGQSERNDDQSLTLTPAPEPLPDCEALASPYSDSVLGHIIGRCFV
jgi:hypothetical protein